MTKSYQEINAETIDRWIEEGWEWGQPISHETYLNAKNGNWDVLLTPVNPVPHEWFGNLKDKKILGLASGGGQQMPIFVALGANCTVLDYSDTQLEAEKMVADREKYEIDTMPVSRSPFTSTFVPSASMNCCSISFTASRASSSVWALPR